MPKGWVESTLGQYIHINTGKLDVNAASEFGEYPFFTCSRETYRINEAAFEGESVLVAGNGDLNVKYYDGEFNAYQRTYVLNSVDKNILDNRFLFLYMQTYIEYLRSETRGTVIQYLKKGQFTDAKIKLPPVPEQKRIVDLISSVDSYIEVLQQQLESAKKTRNAVLHELLTAGGDDWVETTIGDLVKVTSGFAFSTKSWSEHGIPVIKINNVRNGKVSIENCSYVQDPVPDGASRFLLNEGDLLITLTGEIGAIGFVTQSQPMYLNQRVGRLDLLTRDRVSLKFIGLFLSLPEVRAEMWSHGKGNAQLNISPTSIHSITIDLPPLPEQKRIVEIMNVIDEVIDRTVITTNKAHDLRSGLLSDLLSGEHEIPATYDKVMGAA